ncbi:MAG: hypothetical protein KJ964_06595 [Verrucomicrobia bacterium]|nr:hypothetical protein [Verrucomicrobiota bacterium]MBU1735100.1 hypothetical protein [Verrucomicrobiota bacterium]MBU1856384.1 hypothetical protein [Verrucomicrobiota bacterium]
MAVKGKIILAFWKASAMRVGCELQRCHSRPVSGHGVNSSGPDREAHRDGFPTQAPRLD